ncbi:MAG: MFS transporter, partial [Tepidisphaeraceae bacterium]
GRMRVDTVGISLVAIGFGCLEYVLDKGQEDDWFGSNLIIIFTTVATLALVAGVLWEIYGTDDPVVDISLLKERNFAISCVLYFLFGFTLFGTTVMLPQMVQQLFGYTAEDAGMVITPGAMVVMAMVPIVVRLMKYVGPRVLIAAGFLVIGGSLVYFQTLDLTADYRSIVIGRIIQGAGISMLFVPTSTLAYSRLPKNKNNKASSLTNLFRNVGGSAGIAFVTTMLQRRSQAHQTFLAGHVTAYDHATQNTLAGMVHTLVQAGVNQVEASARALAMLYRTVQRQAQMLSYIDVFAMLMLVSFLVPLVLFFVKPFKVGAAPPEAH